MSVDVDKIFESVYLSVCLFVRSIGPANSETIDPKVFKLSVGMTLGCPSGTVYGVQRSRVSK